MAMLVTMAKRPVIGTSGPQKAIADGKPLGREPSIAQTLKKG